MIIKDKPFRIPSCQAMACCWYFAPCLVLHDVDVPASCLCPDRLARRWPGFVKLEVYQVLLSRIAADRWADRQLGFGFHRVKSSIAARRRRLRLFDELGPLGGGLCLTPCA